MVRRVVLFLLFLMFSRVEHSGYAVGDRCYLGVILRINPLFGIENARLVLDALRAAGVSDEDMPVHLAVMWQETHYRHNLIGDKGRSLGLYQIGLWEARTVDSGITREMLLEIEHNVRVGAVYLRRLIERYGLDRALKRYNGSWAYVEAVRKKIHKINKWLN
ncbi:MAG: transglycosylase SLT domain-containing protein [candidate division WOR-3 bacterium]